jgi:AcrR family transcriptional regulator
VTGLETPESAQVSGPISKREQNKADKKRRILAAAKELFESNGFEETTTAEISEQAGVGTGTLYLYVGSKEELLVEVFEDEVGRAWQKALTGADRSRPVLDQLLDAFSEVSDFHDRDPRLALSYFKELIFLPTQEGISATEDFMRTFYERLAALLTDAQDDGWLRPDVAAHMLARNLFASWYQLMLRRFTGRIAQDDVRPLLEASFSVSLMGLTPRP